MVLGKIKKIVGAVIALAMVASLFCVSVSASGVPAANKSEGYVTEVKGTKNDSTWKRTHSYDGKMAQVTMLLQSGKTISSATGIVNSHDTSNTGYDCKIVHSAFRFNCTASFQIRIRNNSSNTQWMNFSSGGSITANSSGTNKGATWTTGEDHKVDIIADVTQGIGYLFVDGKLASYSTNLQKNGKWYGYLIYTAGTWEGGDCFIWKYGYSTTAVNYVLYNDTEDYTVRIEDVLVDCGLSDAPTGDSSIFFESNSIRDYLVDAGYKVSEESDEYIYGDITYNDVDSATIEGTYYNPSDGNVQNFMRMISGFYPEGDYHVSVGGDIMYISYTQVINSASRVEMRLRNNYENRNGNRFTFTPTENEKIRVSSFSNVERILDKDWDDPVDIGIVVDFANTRAYTFIDGKQLGGAFNYFKNGYGNFQDLRMYLNGTEDNETASVTISDWSMELYDGKDINGLFAEIEGIPVYFTESNNSIEYDEGEFGLTVTAKTTLGASLASGNKMYAVVYDSEGKLIDIENWDYVDGDPNESLVFELDGADTVKLFCFTADFEALAVPKTYDIEQPAVAEE